MQFSLIPIIWKSTNEQAAFNGNTSSRANKVSKKFWDDAQVWGMPKQQIFSNCLYWFLQSVRGPSQMTLRHDSLSEGVGSG